jgi:hypothetical protein
MPIPDRIVYQSFSPSHEDFLDQEIRATFNNVITNLKKQKEYLALQLNYEFGNLTEDTYHEQEEQYLVESQDIPVVELKRGIDILFTFSGVIMDAEEIAGAFNCPIDTAEEALQMFLEGKQRDRI